MATTPLFHLSQVKTISGNAPWTLTFPEAASQTFKLGAILTFDASGNVIEAGTDPARILGVAAQDGLNLTTAATDRTQVWIANDDNVFMGNLMSTGVAVATAQQQIGQDQGVVKVGNNWFVDMTHARRVTIIDLDRRDAVGDIGGRVHFVFHPQFRILFHTS